MNTLVDRHHSQLLHPGEEQGDVVEAGEVPTVVDSGSEPLVTGGSELEQLGVVCGWSLLDVTLLLDNFEVPDIFCHVECEHRPGQLLQSEGRLTDMLLLESVDGGGMEREKINPLLYCALCWSLVFTTID